MTDNEIIKALECCTKLRYDIQQPTVCLNCPYYNLDDCTFELKAKALDLINRQKAEIERLNTLIAETNKYRGEVIHAVTHIDEIKAEAVKEFAERLKERKMQSTMDGRICTFEMIDNLLKEMVGEEQCRMI